MKSSLIVAAPPYRGCVVYLKDRVEHRSAWFTSAARAQRAVAIVRARYGEGNAIIVRD